MADDNDVKPPTPGGDDNKSRRQGGNRRGQNRHRRNQNPNQPGHFKGKTKEIEGDTFDNTGPHDAATFNKSLKNIADYLQLIHDNDTSEAVRNMTPMIIDIPAVPTPKKDPNDNSKTIPVPELDIYQWKRKYTKACDKKDKYEENMTKAYIIVYHQCSPHLKNDLEASDAFAKIRQN